MTPSAANPPRIPLARLFFAPIGLVFVAHAIYLSSVQAFWAVDDAYITFRYIDNWLDGQGLVFNPGERVEGYSNFLWLLVITPFRALGLDAVLVSQGLGLAAGLATLWMTVKLADRLLGVRWIGIAAAAMLALDGSFARWAIDGLETLLFALLVSIAVYLEAGEICTRGWPEGEGEGDDEGPARVDADDDGPARGRSWFSGTGLVLGFAALTRPEGVAVLGLISMFRVLVAGPRCLWSRDFWSRLLTLWCWSALVVAPHLVFRLAYYGDWVPNTARAKIEPGLTSVVRGIVYLVSFLLQRWGPVLGVVSAALWWRHRGRPGPTVLSTPLSLPLFIVTVITGYIVLVGGDWMNVGRYFMHFGPLFALLTTAMVARGFSPNLLEPVGEPTEGGRGSAAVTPTRHVSREIPRTWPAKPGRMTIGVLTLMGLAGWLGTSWRGERMWFQSVRVNHLERKMVIDYLVEHAPPGATLLSEEIGQIPYYTGLVTYDLFGLTDRHVALSGNFDRYSNTGSQRYDFNYSLGLSPDYLVMTVFRDAFERNVSAAPGQARFEALRQYELVPLPMPQERLELYRKKSLAAHQIRP